MKFDALKSYAELKVWAKNPLDLSLPGVITSERIKKYCVEGVGYKLLFGTERVTDEIVESLCNLAEEANAFEKMEKMQGGEVINKIEGYPSEEREVLHTALRDFFGNARKEPAAFKAASQAKQEVEKLTHFLKETNAFRHLVLIGIGGSELGPKALYLALDAFQKKERTVDFVGNIDPDEMVKTLSRLDLKHTAVAVVSKSGTTLETSTNEAFAREIFTSQGLNPNEHFVAVTGEGGPMDKKEKYLEVFYIWDWVGGRYSGSSVIGGLVIGFSTGIENYLDFLKGAHAMDQNALNRNVKENLPLMGALLRIWNHNFLNIPTTAIIPYSQALWRFPAHLQQLEMESNGKQIDKEGRPVSFATGPIIWGEAGTNAQHSFFQLIHQGTEPICLELIGYVKPQKDTPFSYQGTTSQEKLLANLFAQSLALAVGQANDNPNKRFFGNRPSHILLGEKLTPYALGALLSYYENKVAFQGFIWNINSFDQEGVQLGKVLANEIINIFKGTGKAGAAEAFVSYCKPPFNR